MCAHPKRAEIDRAVAGGAVSNRAVAGRYALSRAALDRHAAAHLPARVQLAAERVDASLDAPLLERVRWLEAKVRECIAAVQSGLLSEKQLAPLLAVLDKVLDRYAKLTGAYAPERHQVAHVDLRSLTPEQHLEEMSKLRAELDAEIERARATREERTKVLS